MHHFPFNPTPDTLSFFMVYMSYHIEPHSVGSYLSGICDRLEIYYPDAHCNRESQLVKKTLAGMKKLCSKPICHKQPITRTHLLSVVESLCPSSPYDSILFATMLIIGTCSLLRLGELTVLDNPALRNFRKVVVRDSVKFDESSFSFWLPFHKANQLFEGNHIVIPSHWSVDSLSVFRQYLQLRNSRFPFHPHLWITSQGVVPTCNWFMRRLHHLKPDTHWAGQSMRAGGAMAMAEDRSPPQLIQAAGRWSSDTFQIYICRNPIILNAILAANQNLHLLNHPCN
ncbi:hypothetical protein GYMLUDRAFT_165033 [Collybiopsis luxurians FD-317 M1]|uniref:Tyr recombinase domain-containing protein n=1 Tax=Collybiopsis luxurians FD-317 M1 TaxID=944289 RepID=A0A0D0D060_9AGAR|nr:hypothetical protein GYMLUDRAFT_165033 [Collybiopsis luxurians FD-317 M1]